MRKYFDDPGLIEFFKNFDLRQRSEDKGRYIFLGFMIAIFIFAGIGIYWIIKKRLEDDYSEEWDDEE